MNTTVAWSLIVVAGLFLAFSNWQHIKHGLRNDPVGLPAALFVAGWLWLMFKLKERWHA